MRLRYGSGCDTVIPIEPEDGQALLGTRAVGPLGFLEELELRTGSAGAVEGQRFLLYLRALSDAEEAASDEGATFYASSLRESPFGVSSHLLSVRDRLAASGFDFELRENMPRRLRDFCRVEKLLPERSPVRSGFGDRVEAVVRKLEGGAAPVSLDAVTICEEYELLPRPVRRLIDALAAAGVELQYEFPEPQADPETDLGRVQRALLHDGAGVSSYEDDGSLCIARCGTSMEALETASRMLRGGIHIEDGQGESTALVVPEGLELLDEFLRADGSPAAGTAAAGRGAAGNGESGALSSLRLISARLWDPPDAEAFAGLLSSPVSPLPPSMSRELLAAFEEAPGVGNPLWNEALEKALSKIDDEQKRRKLEERHRSLVEGPRYSRFDGAPAEVCAGLFDETAGLLRARAAYGTRGNRTGKEVDTDGPEAGLAAACSWMADALKAAYDDRLVPEHRLNQLIDFCIDAFSAGRTRERQAGSILAVGSPEQIGEPVDRLLWVPAMERREEADGFFSSPEFAWLERHGTPLDDPSKESERSFAASVSALSRVRRELIMVVTEESAGDRGVEPLVPVIEALTGRREKERVSFVRKESAAGEGKPPGAETHERIPAAKLPSRRAYWTIEPALFSRGRRESYSSLTDLFFYPYRYLLNRVAGLRRSSLGALPEGPLFLGRLFHSFTELLLAEEGVVSQQRVHEWVDRRFEEVLRAYGRPLLEAGREREKERMRSHVQRSLGLLARLLSEAGATQVDTEYKLDGRLGSIDLTGRIDLYAAGGPNPVIIDFKWGGFESRRAEIEEGRDMQLALYALLADAVHQNPSTAYLIASRGAALTHPDSRFESAEVPEGALPSREVYPPLLEAMEETAAYRYAQLEEGRVALSPEDTDEQLPNGLIELPETAHRYDEFLNLLGWSDQ